MDHSDPIRLAAIAPWVGHSSNVWMHRQFDRLGEQLPLVVAWQYLNQDQFPLPHSQVRIVPEEFAAQIDGWSRKIDSFMYPRFGGERFGPKFRKWFRGQMTEARIDGVLGQFGHFAMAAEAACQPIGIPIFAHFHGYDISGRLAKRRYRRAIEKKWHKFAAIICVANYQRDWLIDLGYDPESVALIPCGAPTREIKAKTDQIRDSLPPQDPTRSEECHFVFIGRFVDKKDPISLVKAFQVCHQLEPHSRLTLAGFGPSEQATRDFIEKGPRELQTAIRFIGSLSPDQVLEELVKADVYVQHSRTAPNGDKEGWPVVIAEAMAAGMPVVSTRHAGIVDQVIEGETGFLCDEGDWQTMGEDMAKLASNVGMRRSMAEKSQRRMMDFDAESQIQRLRELMLDRIAMHRFNQSKAA